jgi:hypothetical protein
MTNRRTFLGAVTGWLLGGTRVARAQPPAMPVIGFARSSSIRTVGRGQLGQPGGGGGRGDRGARGRPASRRPPARTERDFAVAWPVQWRLSA